MFVNKIDQFIIVQFLFPSLALQLYNEEIIDLFDPDRDQVCM